MDKDEELYLNYLKKQVRNHESERYSVLLDRLWEKEFYSIVPNDENRERDGLLLRVNFGDRIDSNIFGACRVLEMLIALSRRMEFEIDGTGYNVDYVDLFWELLNNLDLLDFTDDVLLNRSMKAQFDHILDVWLERKYASDGSGSIFPIVHNGRGRYKPQYKVEIWYQMMQYLEQRYPF